MKTIGERLKIARKQQNLTLTDIHKETGLSTGNLSELENNKFMPSANALIALKKLLNVSIDWILTGEHSPPYNQINQQLHMECCIKEAEEKDYMLNNEEKEIIDGYRRLEDEKRNYIKGFINICLVNTSDEGKEANE